MIMVEALYNYLCPGSVWALIFYLNTHPQTKPEPGGTSQLDKHGSKQPAIKAINCEQNCNGVKQGSKTNGPRAACGPPKVFVRPAETFCLEMWPSIDLSLRPLG